MRNKDTGVEIWARTQDNRRLYIQYRKSYRDGIKEFVDFLLENSDLSEVDEAEFIEAYRAAGYPWTAQSQKELRRVFTMAKTMQSRKATQGQKRTVAYVATGIKGYGTKQLDLLRLIQKELATGGPEAAKDRLLEYIRREHWDPINSLAFDYNSFIGIDDILVDFTENVQLWHEQYDPLVAKERTADSRTEANGS